MTVIYEITAAISAGKDKDGEDRTIYQRVGSIFETSKPAVLTLSLTHALANPNDALLVRSPDKEATFDDKPNQVVFEVNSVIQMGLKPTYTRVGVILSTKNPKIRVLKLNLIPINADSGLLVQPPRQQDTSETES